MGYVLSVWQNNWHAVCAQQIQNFIRWAEIIISDSRGKDLKNHTNENAVQIELWLVLAGIETEIFLHRKMFEQGC